MGFPFEFVLFGLMLFGIALAHRHALQISVVGLVLIVVYEGLITAFPTGAGTGALLLHFQHEWVTVANLLLLLVGFELLASHFEESNVSDHLPCHLPEGWSGSLALLAIIFALSGVLDNIAAAVLGGVMARHVYKGRVAVGFLAAIVASANAGGAGSVIGDTTTTLMWLKGVSPFTVLPAYLPSLVAFAVFAPFGAWCQHRVQPVSGRESCDKPLHWRRIWVVAIILVAAITANILATSLSEGEESAPWLGMALWAAILLTSPIARPDWNGVWRASKGAMFLIALVLSASLMPVQALPDPSWKSAFGLGILSSVFDNIPLTVMALEQGDYDWALLAYAVGFGGSMLWFGSSAGVALTNDYPEGRSLKAWIREGWFVPLAYIAGFAAMFALTGWDPT